MGIVVQHLCKRFGSFVAVDDVSFEVDEGSLVALLGPSGGGKSTILRIIAGLERPDSGEVLLTGETATHLPARERGVGFVFQHYALFKHMTVRQNIAFGLEVRRTPKAEVKRRVDELLQLIQLEGLADRYPAQLSGGQRQRVALARALAPRPRVLLLDEPFGALDARVRSELREWLRRLHEETRVTSLFVTHDQEEALDLADRVAVINRGRVEQVGTPQEIYERPATPFVASFLGPVNVLRGEVRQGRVRLNGAWEVALPTSQAEAGVTLSGTAYLRPHDVYVDTSPGARGGVAARVRRALPLGAVVRMNLTLGDGQPLQVELARDRFEELGVGPGDLVFVTPRDLKVFVSDYAI